MLKNLWDWLLKSLAILREKVRARAERKGKEREEQKKRAADIAKTEPGIGLWALGAVIFFLPVFGTLYLARKVGVGDNAALPVILPWVVLYVYVGWERVREREWIVIERLGKFYRIAHAGPRILCLPGIVDRVRARGTLQSQKQDLFMDEPRNLVEFKDGVSAGVPAEVWFKVGPDGIFGTAANPYIYKFVYAVTHEPAEQKGGAEVATSEKEKPVKPVGPYSRIEEIFDHEIRIRLGGMDVDDAQKQEIKKQVISAIVGLATQAGKDEGLYEALADMGAYLNPKQGVLIGDIVLQEEDIKLRRKVFEGEKIADEAELVGRGYARAIFAIIEYAKEKHGMDISWAEAKRVYSEQRGLQTLNTVAAKGSNVNFVAQDLDRVLLTMSMGAEKKNPENVGGEK